MRHHSLRKYKLLMLTLLLLALAIACGAAATTTPVPTATNAPVVAPTVAAAPTATKPPVATAAPAATATPVPRAAPTPTLAPAIPAKARVDRLVVALQPPPHETNLAWMGSNTDVATQLKHMQEPLIETDHVTGAMVPGLATFWEMAPDGKTWTFKLRKNVPFHFGWGEFTARDVPHSISTMVREEAITTDTPLLRSLFGKTEAEVQQNIQAGDAHTVVLRLKRPEAELDQVATQSAGNLVMQSKAQWDAEGKAGYERRPVGTGPWRYVGRALGSSLDLERVEAHWKQTPEFEQLRLSFAPEVATRLAALLAGEAHMAVIERSLNGQATARGMKVLRSQLPAGQLTFIMGGVYRPDLADRYDPTVPFLDVKVREAMHRAVDRKELIATLFGGEGEPAPVFGYHRSQPGWNPEWAERFEERYGYDPARARKLLEEAGYPNGFRFKVIVVQLPGAPESIPAAEALALYFQKVGLQPELVTLEFAKVRAAYRAKKTHSWVYPVRPTLRPPHHVVRVFNISGKEGLVSSYEDEAIDEKYAQLVQTVDPAERARIQKEMGDIKFKQYAEIPIVWLAAQIVVNPKVVAEYVFSGAIGGLPANFEYAKAAK